MGVDVDKTRCHDAAFGVDLAGADVVNLVRDLRNHSVGDRDVGVTGWGSGPVNNTAITDHDVWLSHELPFC